MIKPYTHWHPRINTMAPIKRTVTLKKDPGL